MQFRNFGKREAFVAVVLVAVALVALLGLGTAGFPSRPVFQTVTVNGSNTASFGAGAISLGTLKSPLSSRANPSERAISIVVDGTGVAGAATQGFVTLNRASGNTAKHFGLEVGNDVVGHEAVVAVTSSTYSGTPFSLVGGPTGETALYAGGAQTCFGSGTAVGFCMTNAGNFSGAANTTTATGTVTGCTTAPTTTVRFTKFLNMVVASIDFLANCTSSATTFTFTGAIPAAYQPTRSEQSQLFNCTDNGAVSSCYFKIDPGSSTLTVSKQGGAFTASGAKGLNGGSAQTFQYLTN